MTKEPTSYPGKVQKATFNYRSAPIWSIRAAFASFLIFSGLYLFTVAAPAVTRLTDAQTRPAVIRPPDFDGPPLLVDKEFTESTSVLDFGLANLSQWMDLKLGNEIRYQAAPPPGVGGLVANPSEFTWPKRFTSARTIKLINELQYQQELEEARMTIYGQASRGVLVESFLLCLAGLSLILTLRLRENKLLLATNGLQFPSAMMAELNWKRKRSWADLSAISLKGNGSTAEPHVLQFYFSSGGEASIHLARLSPAEQEKFFLALDEFAEHAMRSPALLAYRHELLNSSKNADPSFTQLWEEELNSHFAATNFVALSPESKLQNGKIKVIMHMSSGGLSAVYLAERNKQMVVIKESVVPPGSSEANREKARDMFQREASMLMKLSHPQIARVIDHFQENERDYLMLEYIPGVTLREYVRRHGPQTEARVTDWARQIAEILQYLHNQDPPVIHRDLTPDNLMITPSGKIVLIDFGAANQFLGTATGTIVGKQFYISPEQFRGKAEPASDIYSLGGTLHYLLTGIEPEALSVSHPKQLRESLSEDIDALIAKCTATNVSNRIKSADEFLQSLSSGTQSLPAGAQSLPVGALASEPAKTAKNEGVSISIKQEEKQLK